ncbi:MAG: hypothetical protein M3256_21860 [Actinomycetota bacterium]|nr:hypothetical protein [Actinomycetota bacterium]
MTHDQDEPASPEPIEAPTQRITLTLDIIDEPGNDTIAVGALHTVVRHLEYDGIIPLLIGLEIRPTPTT